MHSLEKFLLMAGVARNAYGRWRFQRVLSALVTVALLAATVAVLMSVLAIGGVYAVYLILIEQGSSQGGALLLSALVALLLVALLLMAIRRRIGELKSSVSAPVGDAVDAFFDGLMSGGPPKI